MYNSIDIKEIDRISIDDRNILIDIRDKYEYILSHIRRSINIPYNYLNAYYNKYLDFNHNYYIYCDSGNKSRKLCCFLNSIGYNVIDLVGGYKEYVDG